MSAGLVIAALAASCERAPTRPAPTGEVSPPIALPSPPLALATIGDSTFVLLRGRPATVAQLDDRGATPRPELDGAVVLLRLGDEVIVVGERGQVMALGAGPAPARLIVDLATKVFHAWSGPGADGRAALVVLTGTGALQEPLQHVRVDPATGASTTTAPGPSTDARGPMEAAGTTSVVNGAGVLQVVVGGVTARLPVQGVVGCLALTSDAVWWLEHDPVMPHVGVMARIAHARLAALVGPAVDPGRAIVREAEAGPVANYACASAGGDAFMLTDRGVRWFRPGRPPEWVVASPGIVGFAVGEQLVWVEPHDHAWRLRRRPWPPR